MQQQGWQDLNLIKDSNYMSLEKLLFNSWYQWFPGWCIYVEYALFILFMQPPLHQSPVETLETPDQIITSMASYYKEKLR